MILELLLPRKLATTAGDPADWLRGALGGSSTASGIRVNPQIALTLPAYFAAIRAISEDVAKVPLFVYRRLEPRGKDRVTSDPRHKLLHDQANALMTAMAFRETIMSHALGWGNGYGEIVFRRDQRPHSMSLLTPSRVTPELDSAGRVLVYRVTNADGTQVTLPAYRMFHLHGLGFDGITGYSIATLARETIALGLAQEKSGSSLFTNAVRAGGVLEYPGKLEPDDAVNLRRSWERAYGGIDNAHKTVILENGMKFSPITIPFKDAQFVEGRGFSVLDIARFFRIPPHKIQHLADATFSNIQEQSLEYVTDTLMAWFRRFESEANSKLFQEGEKKTLFVEHLVEGLLRGDIESRFKAFATAKQWGWMSSNDILEIENRNGIGKQGDHYLAPLNMVPADQFGEEPERPPELPPPTPDDDDESPAGNPALRTIFYDRAREIIRENADDAPQRMAEMFSPILEDTYSRVLRIESERVDRLKTAEEIDKFYGDHLSHVHDALLPISRTFAGTMRTFLGREVDPEQCACELARSHVGRSQEDMSENRRRAGKWPKNGRAKTQADAAVSVMARMGDDE